MTTFEWTAIGLITVGMVIPFWIMVILTIIVVEQGRRKDVAKRVTYVHEYAKLMKAMGDLLESSKSSSDGKFNGPTMVVYLREFKEYPQYRDATLLFLESLTITGSARFDDICKVELKNVEAHLLGLKDE